jgi:hypothetical protein
MLIIVIMVVVMMVMMIVIVVRVVMVLVFVMVTMVGVGSPDHIQGLFQNPVRHLHAADRLIEQIRHFRVLFLTGQLRPLPEIFAVMIIVLHPMGQQYPQFVDDVL